VTAPPRLSVVIPAFNEAIRLPPYLDEVVGFLEGRGEPYEVVVVDDGSTDATATAVEALAARHPAVRLLPLGRNRGKGAAVRAGMLAAAGAARLFTDADGATPIAELKRLEPALASGADIAIGSRVLLDPAVAVRTRRHRVAAGRVFNWLVGASACAASPTRSAGSSSSPPPRPRRCSAGSRPPASPSTWSCCCARRRRATGSWRSR